MAKQKLDISVEEAKKQLEAAKLEVSRGLYRMLAKEFTGEKSHKTA